MIGDMQYSLKLLIIFAAAAHVKTLKYGLSFAAIDQLQF